MRARARPVSTVGAAASPSVGSAASLSRHSRHGQVEQHDGEWSYFSQNALALSKVGGHAQCRGLDDHAYFGEDETWVALSSTINTHVTRRCVGLGPARTVPAQTENHEPEDFEPAGSKTHSQPPICTQIWLNSQPQPVLHICGRGAVRTTRKGWKARPKSLFVGQAMSPVSEFVEADTARSLQYTPVWLRAATAL